jgi:hypothetical protein
MLGLRLPEILLVVGVVLLVLWWRRSGRGKGDGR